MEFAEIRRVTLSGNDFTPIQFNNPASAYLVKNFSSADCYVSFDEDATTDTSTKIAKDYGQVCDAVAFSKLSGTFVNAVVKTIYIKGSGEVEVAQVC